MVLGGGFFAKELISIMNMLKTGEADHIPDSRLPSASVIRGADQADHQLYVLLEIL